MTMLVATPTQESYRLEDALQEPNRSSSVMPTALEEVEFEDLLLKKLGARGWGRLYHFRQYYGPGWGQGSGKPLSPKAMEAFRRFLKDATFPTGKLPSVFLTDRGGLELCWEDSAGKSVQLEFTSHGIEFFQESNHEEELLELDQVSKLSQKLNRT